MSTDTAKGNMERGSSIMGNWVDSITERLNTAGRTVRPASTINKPARVHLQQVLGADRKPANLVSRIFSMEDMHPVEAAKELLCKFKKIHPADEHLTLLNCYAVTDSATRKNLEYVFVYRLDTDDEKNARAMHGVSDAELDPFTNSWYLARVTAPSE